MTTSLFSSLPCTQASHTPIFPVHVRVSTIYRVAVSQYLWENIPYMLVIYLLLILYSVLLAVGRYS